MKTSNVTCTDELLTYSIAPSYYGRLRQCPGWEQLPSDNRPNSRFQVTDESELTSPCRLTCAMIGRPYKENGEPEECCQLQEDYKSSEDGICSREGNENEIRHIGCGDGLHCEYETGDDDSDFDVGVCKEDSEDEDEIPIVVIILIALLLIILGGTGIKSYRKDRGGPAGPDTP